MLWEGAWQKFARAHTFSLRGRRRHLLAARQGRSVPRVCVFQNERLSRRERASERYRWKGMRLGFFGGTFDPVHRGHLAVASAALEKLGLDLVYFVPTDVPPHKRGRNLTEFRHRFAMLALATAEDRRFLI